MWSYNTSVSQWIRGSTWAVAILEVIHLVGLIFLLGSVFMWSLRCFGLFMERDSVQGVARNLAPVTLTGFFLMSSTGYLIFSSGATRYVNSQPFHFKMFFFFLATLVQCMIYIMVLTNKNDDRRSSPRWVVLGTLALLLWLSVGIAGRAIAFI